MQGNFRKTSTFRYEKIRTTRVKTPIHSRCNLVVGKHSFTFNHVSGSSGSPSSPMFEDCVSPLILRSMLSSETNQMVAIKKTANAFDNYMDAKRTLHEIKLLRHLDNEFASYL
ncbi:hypothetical protein L1887_08799 [Cichorium endivia]|nr:hypothetical protein L1887_08799 [Cichorium endivia]